jgi:hypothetical protein
LINPTNADAKNPARAGFLLAPAFVSKQTIMRQNYKMEFFIFAAIMIKKQGVI